MELLLLSRGRHSKGSLAHGLLKGSASTAQPFVFSAKGSHLIVRPAPDAGNQCLTRYSVARALQFFFSQYTIQKRALCHYGLIFRQLSTCNRRESFCLSVPENSFSLGLVLFI